MGIRANSQNAVSSILPWFDADMAFGTLQLPHAYRLSADELARTRLEGASHIKSRGVIYCPTRYATITQACVPPTIPARPLKRLRARNQRRRSR